MYNRHMFRITAVFLCVALASAQNNYVDDYDFDSPPPPQRSGPTRTFSRPSGPAPSGPRPTPVAILKQIDRHNEDGSYTYGYEGGDGSFKIETKLVTGEVMGKYGYVDDTGKVRVVEYGANRYGFMPAGEGITVAPPTIVDETTKRGPNGEILEEYYPDENVPPPQPRRPAPRPRPQPRPQPQYEPEPQFDDFIPAPPQPQPRRPSHSSSGPAPPRAAIPGAAPVFSPAPVYEERPAPQQHRSFSAPAPQQQHQHRSFSAPAPQQQQHQHRSFSAPAPRPAPQPQVISRPPPSPRFESLPPPPPQRVQHLPPPPSRSQHARTSGGILDQLERDYALPQSAGVATHDITFSSY